MKIKHKITYQTENGYSADLYSVNDYSFYEGFLRCKALTNKTGMQVAQYSRVYGTDEKFEYYQFVNYEATHWVGIPQSRIISIQDLDLEVSDDGRA